MKKILLTLCLFVISFNILAIDPETPPGSGTENDPYQLSKAEHLLWMCGKGFKRESFILKNDIDAKECFKEYNEFDAKLVAAKRISFCGSLDGKGYCIKNLGKVYGKMVFDDGTYAPENSVGVYFDFDNAEIKNLAVYVASFEDISYLLPFEFEGRCEIYFCEINGNNKFKKIEVNNGYFSRYIYSGNNFEDITIKNYGTLANTIRSNNNFENISINRGLLALYVGYEDDSDFNFLNDIVIYEGSLAKRILKTTIKNIKSYDGTIVNYLEDSLIDGCLVEGSGSIVKECISSVIRNAKSSATVFSGGGLVGTSDDSKISTSLFCGEIDGPGSGIIDYARDKAGPTIVQDCYFDLTHAAANGYGTGVSPAELRRQETFEHWDFENVWEITEGFSYPTLRDSSSSGTKTIIGQGLSIAGVSIKGKLSDEELNEIKENPTICLYSEGIGAEITVRQELQESKPSTFSYKSKEEAVSISYSGKSKSLKFSSASPKITLGRSSDEGFTPCRLSDCSMKLTSSMTIIKDISEHLRQNGKLSLYDSEIFGNVLGGTTVELKQKGNNLSYKGANGDVKISCKINLKNKMIQIKYISNNVIQPVILCEKK